MKVKCINAENEIIRLTIGYDYEVVEKSDDGFFYTLFDDKGDKTTFRSYRFEVVEDGVKHDNEKLKPTLLFDDMPLAIREVLRVLDYGAKKYSEGNWLKVEDGMKRYRNACDRHRLEGSIDAHDNESGLLHLAHEATNALMLLELKMRELQDK